MTDCNETKSHDRVYKWLMLVMLAVTYFLMHGSRQVFNASLPQIKVDLAGHGATDAQLGLSRTFFLFAYGCMVPFAGIAADFFRRKWVIVIGTLLFSTSVFFTGYADSMLMFFVMYGFMNGIGQCMIPGAASSLIAQYHTETRSTALSIYQSALYVGILVSSGLAGWLGGASQGGWRISFWIFGGVAIVWMVVLTVFLHVTIELDVFHGKLSGLIMAEVEFDSTEDAREFVAPSWFIKEVTLDSRYQNANLVGLNFSEI